MNIAHMHQYIVKGFLLKCKTKFTETFFILAQFAKNVECLLGGIANNLVHRIFLRLGSLGRRECCTTIVVLLQSLFKQFLKFLCGKLVCILILRNASTQHLNEHFKTGGRQLNSVELFDKAGAKYTFLYISVKYAHHAVTLQCFGNHALHYAVHALHIVFLARSLANISSDTHKAL